MSRAPFTKVHDVPNPVAARVLPLRRLGLQKGKRTYKLGPRNSVVRGAQQANQFAAPLLFLKSKGVTRSLPNSIRNADHSGARRSSPPFVWSRVGEVGVEANPWVLFCRPMGVIADLCGEVDARTPVRNRSRGNIALELR